jgi:hypothetical protein
LKVGEKEMYNGWSNYPTWAVRLHLDNDAGLYWSYRRLNRQARNVNQLANYIKDFVHELMPPPKGLAGDLLYYALEIVDWDEIAESIREDFPIDDDENDNEDSDDE